MLNTRVSVTLWPVELKNNRHIPLKTWSGAMFSRRRISKRLTEMTKSLKEITTLLRGKPAYLERLIDHLSNYHQPSSILNLIGGTKAVFTASYGICSKIKE